MASRQFCTHYPNGGMMNAYCEVGIEMRSLADKTVRPFRFPCYEPAVSHLCPSHEHYTKAEIAESDAAAVTFISGLNAFSKGESRTCPTCGGAIEQIDLYEKSEPDTYSLYTRPCGHRHGLWSSAPDWALNEGIVHVIPLGIEDDAL